MKSDHFIRTGIESEATKDNNTLSKESTQLLDTHILPVTLSTKTCHFGNSCSRCLISRLFLRSAIVNSEMRYNILTLKIDF